ncbi:hypothetical protein CLH62_06150 [Marinobacter guineae]|uniref:FAD-dependent urate hydroxylase HpyO/Asp monooxygenase CreE-like FAD/NAD(P)-binding domain-containing protein n=1 Tax=Marinobacter guineae TaxID=432303 RepID=A0A2G1VK77_9GAMM|nr:FAD/NAD(P)-binding protein [Marinobacter guineae]PHQ27155.1 hypothetical protein CLH62_06150 [Marinobacter guineae]
MEKVLAIVGAGAASVAFLDNFLNNQEKWNNNYTVYIVEKNPTFGPGQAYNEDLDSNILNTKTGYITVFPEKKGDFHEWLHKYPEAWQWKYPNFVADKDTYAPRPLFGQYLQFAFSKVVSRAVRCGVKVIPVNAEVTDLHPLPKGYLVETACGIEIRADYTFLLCGTLENAKQDTPKMRSGVIANPYPLTKLTHWMGPEASVAIIGSRLSAIDAIIALKEAGHRGRIVMHSRSGYFPAVRGTQGRFNTKYLSSEYMDQIAHCRGTLTLQDLAEMVQGDIEFFHEQFPDHPRETLRLPAPVDNLTSFLETELRLAQHPRAWQAVLYATNAIIERLWDMLAPDAREVFWNNYVSMFLSYRVSIPSENAEKILRYLRRGDLFFKRGPMEIEKLEDGSVTVITDDDNEVERYDYAILSTGSPKQFSQSNSTLLASLEAKGVVLPHPLGGLDIDWTTYKVLNSQRKPSPRLYALGEVTSGKFFFTSALDIICRHAHNCAYRFCQEHLHEGQPSYERSHAASG